MLSSYAVPLKIESDFCVWPMRHAGLFGILLLYSVASVPLKERETVMKEES